MNKMLYANDRDSVMEHVKAVYYQAIKNDRHYDKSQYEWRLGVEVIHYIADGFEFINEKDIPMHLFGIPVCKDYYNPTRMELWKNITND